MKNVCLKEQRPVPQEGMEEDDPKDNNIRDLSLEIQRSSIYCEIQAIQ